MAIASANEGTRCCDLGVVQSSSADTASLFSNFLQMDCEGAGPRPSGLLVSCEGGWNYIFGKLVAGKPWTMV